MGILFRIIIQLKYKASLYIIANEIDAIIAWKIVPNDTRAHVSELISEYFHEGDPTSVVTQVFYTDNVVSDQNKLQEIFTKIQPKSKVAVIQDLWHAQQRIIKLLAKVHPDFKESTKEIRAVFQRCLLTSEEGGWPDVYSMQLAVTEWEKKFSSIQKIKLDGEELISALGKLADFNLQETFID